MRLKFVVLPGRPVRSAIVLRTRNLASDASGHRSVYGAERVSRRIQMSGGRPSGPVPISRCHRSATASVATRSQNGCASAFSSWKAMPHTPGMSRKSSRADCKPTPWRRKPRTMKKAYIDVPPDSTGRVNAKPARVRPYRINHACRPCSVRNRSRVSKA